MEKSIVENIHLYLFQIPQELQDSQMFIMMLN